MAGLGTGAGPPVVNVYHEKSRILPDVSRVLACLYEKDVKFQTIRASYKDLLSLQASRSVPVPFYDGPVFLQDSRAICRYIAETYEHQGYPFLLGKDVLERASIEQWLRHEEHAFDPPSRALFCHLAFPPDKDDDEDDIDREVRKLEEVLEVYEQRLDETKFLAGSRFTLADLVHLPGVHHVITSDKFLYLYDSRKNVRRWWQQISARDSWQQVLRDMKTVEEQQELEEKQKQQRPTEPSSTFAGQDIRIDGRQQEGTKPQTVLVAPPSIGAVSVSIPPAPQDRGTTSDQKPFSPNQGKGGFTTTEKPSPPSRHIESTTQKLTTISDNTSKSTFFTQESTPTTAKAHQKTDVTKEVPSPTEKPPLSSRPTDPTTQKTPSSVNGTKSTFVTPSSSPSSAKTMPDTKTPQKPPEQRVTDASVGPEPGQKLKSIEQTAYTPSKEDTPDVINDPNRFSTKKLREMFNPDTEDPQFLSKQEEAPADPKKRSDLHDREKQTTMIPDSGKSGGSPSPDMRAPYTPITDEERSAVLPPNGGTATVGAEKSPPNQQVPHAAPGNDKLAKVGVNTGEPKGASPKTPTGDRNGLAPVHGADSSTIVTSDEQSEKSSTVGEKALEATPRKTSTAERRGTSAQVKELTFDAHVKQEQAGQEILEVQGTGDGDTTEKTLVDKKAAEASSRQTTESIKGVSRTLQGVTGDASTEATPPAPVQAPASGGQNTPIVPHGVTNSKEAVTPSPDDPRGTLPTTPGRLTTTPATPPPMASGKMSAQSPEAPLYDTRNKKADIVETSQTSMAAPNEKPGEEVPRNAGQSSSGPMLMEAQEYVNETYKEQDDQSGAKLDENRMRQGDDVAPNATTNKHKEEDYVANANNNNNRKAQATTNDAPSKLQIQSGKNKPETSKDAGVGINKTANSRSLETSREVQPSSPEKSMGQQQLQETRSATSLQDNVKKSTDTPVLRSEIEQQKKDDFPTEEDKNDVKAPGEVRSEERTSSDTQQDK